jgi:hypothetical protein
MRRDNRRLLAHHESEAPEERQNVDASIAPSELCVGGRHGYGGSRRRLRSITPPELGVARGRILKTGTTPQLCGPESLWFRGARRFCEKACGYVAYCEVIAIQWNDSSYILLQKIDRLGANRLNGSQGAIAGLDFIAFHLLTRIRFEQSRRLQKIFDRVPTVV